MRESPTRIMAINMLRHGASDEEVLTALKGHIKETAMPSFLSQMKRQANCATLKTRIPREAARKLLHEAGTRSMTFPELAVKLLVTVATDDLVGAILDDAPVR